MKIGQWLEVNAIQGGLFGDFHIGEIVVLTELEPVDGKQEQRMGDAMKGD